MGFHIGWFDAFREHGGPTWYGDNRTPVIVDKGILGIVAIFAIFLLAFFAVLPGIRRQRWTSFLSVLLCLSVGTILLVCLQHPCWHEGEVHIYSSYRAFTTERMDAILGIRIGLKHVNITLSSVPPPSSVGNDSNAERRRYLHHVHHNLNYNERFYFTEVKSMERELNEALHKGLPYPILKVIEYLSVDRAGFIWGRQYRLAGYYTSVMLWLAFVCWTLQVVMLCLVPQYFSRVVVAVGMCTLLADLIYTITCPKRLRIRFPGVHGQLSVLDFHFGWCFYFTLVTGALCLLFGSLLALIEAKSTYKLTTFLQADFDEASTSPERTVDLPTRRRHISTDVDDRLDNVQHNGKVSKRLQVSHHVDPVRTRLDFSQT